MSSAMARPGSRARITLISTLVVALTGCLEQPRSLTTFQRRVAEVQHAWQRYSSADKEIIRKGGFRNGLDELALWMARGKPLLDWKTTIRQRKCRVLLYDFNKGPQYADLAVYTCDGTIMHHAKIEPELPCWRLSQVGPRLIKNQAYFEGLKLKRQWELVAGILRRKQTQRDVGIAFGQPYNKGMEAREDGSNAAKWVFLDHSGEAYGLNITMVNDHVVGWRVPAERTLTPEAQKRRLEATEERLMAQLKKMEKLAIEQHEEEMKLLNDIQGQSKSMISKLATLATERTSAAVAFTEGDEPPTHHITVGQKTLVLNGCRLVDKADGELGRQCEARRAICGKGYTCYIWVGFKSGTCAPSDQLARCERGH